MIKEPTILQIEVTKNCNLKCIMCHKGQAIARGENFARENISDLVVQQTRPVFPFLKHAMLFGDGEPLLYRKFWDLVRDIRESSPKCMIDFINNGTMMHFKNREKCFKYRVSHLGLSLGGATSVSHNLIRSGSDFDEIIDSFRALKQEKEKRNVLEPYITALIVVMRSNYHEIPEFVRMCSDLGFLQVECQKMFVTDTSVENQKVSDEQVEPFFCQAGVLAARYNIGFRHYPLKNGADYSFTENTNFNAYDAAFVAKFHPIKNSGYCYYQQPWNTVYVLHDGRVVPDCHWWSSTRSKQYNVCGVLDEHTNILDIWFGSIYNEIRWHIANGNILPQCRGCGLAGGVVDQFRCADTDHEDPLQEGKLVQLNIVKHKSVEKSHLIERMRNLSNSLEREVLYDGGVHIDFEG